MFLPSNRRAARVLFFFVLQLAASHADYKALERQHTQLNTAVYHPAATAVGQPEALAATVGSSAGRSLAGFPAGSVTVTSAPVA
jgi:hypothetical protein